eukprot:1529272-Rhodomonas_salina.2
MDAEDVQCSKQHTTQLHMVHQILYDEGKSDATIGKAMLTFYNGLAGSDSAPAWGPAKYATVPRGIWLDSGPAATAGPEGGGGEAQVRQGCNRETGKASSASEAQQKQQARGAVKEESAAKQQDVEEKEATRKACNQKHKPVRAQTSVRPQQCWSKGVNL